MIVGIDPGFTGAIAILDKKRLVVYDMPLVIVKNKREVDAFSLAKMFKSIGLFKIRYVVIEDVWALPGQSVGAMSRFTYNAGILFGVCKALELEVIRVAPTVWKPALGLSKDKNKSIDMAKKVFPSYAPYFKLKKHDGRAEAALMAYFAKESLG